VAGIWEPEEAIGRFWHRLVGAAASYPRYPEAAVAFRDVRGRLGVYYRALGGPGGVRLAAGAPTASRHRLSLRQRLGLGSEESLERARFDGDTLSLPERLDCFPDAALNRALYFWLAAWFVHAERPPAAADPLRADVLALHAARAATLRVLADWPGLGADYERMARALRAARPRRPLTETEAGMEQVVLSLLGGDAPQSDAGRTLLAAVLEPGSAHLDALRAPRHYRPFLPVPLWGEVLARERSGNRRSESGGGGASAAADEKRRRGRRRPLEQARRRDALILHRFEHLPMLSQMLNLSRNAEDDDLEAARQAAEALDEITVGGHDRPASTRLKLDLDLAPPEVDSGAAAGEHVYPEWDYTRRAYHPAYCRVREEIAPESGSDWKPDAAARRRIRRVRRQFEALRPRRQVFPAQADGDELDLNALVRSYADLRAGAEGSERVYLQARDAERDLAVAMLVDASLSTDSWIDNRRVLDVEKEALLCLSHGLTACGDSHALYAFTSRKRHDVSVLTLKDFDEPLDGRARRRIEALKPGYYTRMGAALRHVTARLAPRPNRHRLLLLLTDGKPNDADHYEGRYGVEDTRRAIHEARRAGLAVFGITVDTRARDYFPYLFGRGAYAIVGRIARLPAALPLIYRQLTAR
jgi:nitric oxide reductase NorD protein